MPDAGSARAMSDLPGGSVQAGLDTVAVIQRRVAAGKMRPLAVGTCARLAAFPNVPTFIELGDEGFEAVAWIGRTAPAGAPRNIRERISAAVGALVRSPGFTERLLAIGALPHPSSIDAMSAFLRSEDARWSAMVERSGARVDRPMPRSRHAGVNFRASNPTFPGGAQWACSTESSAA